MTTDPDIYAVDPDCPRDLVDDAIALLTHARPSIERSRDALILAAQIDAMTCDPYAAAVVLPHARKLVEMLEQRAALGHTASLSTVQHVIDYGGGHVVLQREDGRRAMVPAVGSPASLNPADYTWPL